LGNVYAGELEVLIDASQSAASIVLAGLNIGQFLSGRPLWHSPASQDGSCQSRSRCFWRGGKGDDQFSYFRPRPGTRHWVLRADGLDGRATPRAARGPRPSRVIASAARPGLRCRGLWGDRDCLQQRRIGLELVVTGWKFVYLQQKRDDVGVHLGTERSWSVRRHLRGDGVEHVLH